MESEFISTLWEYGYTETKSSATEQDQIQQEYYRLSWTIIEEQIRSSEWEKSKARPKATTQEAKANIYWSGQQGRNHQTPCKLWQWMARGKTRERTSGNQPQLGRIKMGSKEKNQLLGFLQTRPNELKLMPSSLKALKDMEWKYSDITIKTDNLEAIQALKSHSSRLYNRGYKASS